MLRMKRDRQADKLTDGHRDSMIESAQWADLMKICSDVCLPTALETLPMPLPLPLKLPLFPSVFLQLWLKCHTIVLLDGWKDLPTETVF